MALIYYTGLEQGSINPQLTSANASIVSGVSAISGNYSVRCNATGANQAYYCPSTNSSAAVGNGLLGEMAVPNLWVNFNVRLNILPGATEVLFQTRSSSITGRFSIRLTAAGLLQAVDVSGTLVATGITNLVAGETYNIGVRCSNGVSSPFIVQINGVTELSGNCNQGSAGNIARVYFGKIGNLSNGDVDFTFDDLVFDTTKFQDPRAIVVDALPVSYNPPFPQTWNAGTGASDFSQINGNPISASPTTYIQSPGVSTNDRSLFLFQRFNQDLGLSLLSSILGVQLWAVVSEVTNTTTSFALVLVADTIGIDSVGTSGHNGTTALSYYALNSEINYTTLLPWTPSELDLQEGWGGVASYALPPLRCYYLRMNILYVPPLSTPSLARKLSLLGVGR